MKPETEINNDYWYEPFKRLLLVIDKVSTFVMTVAMATLVVVVTSQVVARYVFDDSFYSAAELSRLLFIWAMFLAIPHGLKYNIHVGIGFITTLLNDKANDYLFRFISFLALILMFFVAYAAYQEVVLVYPQLMPTLPITNAVFYMPILVCAIHSALHLLLLIIGGRDTWQGMRL